MQQMVVSCIRCVGGVKICGYCSEQLTKHGLSKAGKQRYKCKGCGKTQIQHYTYQAYTSAINQQIITLTKEGLGIRSIARVLRISATTLIKRILTIARNITPPAIAKGKTYEVDEISAYVKSKKKKIWMVYALARDTKKVVCFHVGKRTNKTLKSVIRTLEHAAAKRIYTDKLPNYKYLIHKAVHSVSFRGTNHIERNNLTLRIHLKRLNRRTICFSRSLMMLTACLQLYFFG